MDNQSEYVDVDADVEMLDRDDADFDENSVIERLTVREENAKNESTWGRKETIIRLHPSYSHHLNYLKNVKITKSFYGQKLPNGWIKRALEKNVKFNLQKLRLISCGITFDELSAMCNDSRLENVFIHQCSALTTISMRNIAPWLKFAKRILIDIKEMKFEYNWPNYLMERDGDDEEDVKIESLIVRNIPLQMMDPYFFDCFLKVKRI